MKHSDNTGTPAPTSDRVRQVYPASTQAPLEGLYLCQDLRSALSSGGVYVYSNFITSLDGRIAISPREDEIPTIPDATANARDWRLLLELAAPADALIVSGRYIRQLAEGSAQAAPPLEGDVPDDLLAYRASLGLPEQPALIVVSNSLDLPPDVLSHHSHRRIIVATSEQADSDAVHRIEQRSIEVIRVGKTHVDGGRLIEALSERGLALVYSIAGPAVMHTLLEAQVLNRLYLTTVLRVISGRHFATFASGQQLEAPYDFELSALYLDERGPDGVQQLLQVFDHRR